MTDAREVRPTDEQRVKAPRLEFFAQGEAAAFSAKAYEVYQMARELIEWREWNDAWDGACRDGHEVVFHKGLLCPLCASRAETQGAKP